MTDTLGDRMKEYEAVEAERRLDSRLPIVARIDGKCFSSFTRGLARPYDERLSRLMIATTRHLVEESGARAGYTQSDEITLAWHNTNANGQLWLDGRVLKLTSILAGMATAYFNAGLPTALPEKRPGSAVFDARVWNLPTEEEVANLFLWRERDATKNAVSQAARAHFSHKQILDKHGNDMKAMLAEKGIVFGEYPTFFTRGTFIARRIVTRAFTADELDKLPPKHQARLNPDLVVERGEYRVLEMPPFDLVVNRVGVLFRGEDPATEF